MIGAAHAGWRGALGGVTDATIAAMEALGARRERIAAAVGPCIAQASLRGRRRLSARASSPTIRDNARFFADGAAGQAAFRPRGLCRPPPASPPGIGEVEALDLDTYADPDRFFSFRRATHRGEPDYGRQVSADRAALTDSSAYRRSRLIGAAWRLALRRPPCPTKTTSATPTPQPRAQAVADHASATTSSSPSTLMMGYGFDPALSEGIAQAADLPHLDLRVRERGRRASASSKASPASAPGGRRGPGLFALQRPQPGNPRGPAARCGKMPRTR